MTVEDLIRAEMANGSIDFSFRAHIGNGHVHFYVHPQFQSGQTETYRVIGNVLDPDPCVTRAADEPLTISAGELTIGGVNVGQALAGDDPQTQPRTMQTKLGDVDVTIAGDDEITPEMVAEQLGSRTATTIVMTQLPPSVKTFGDFFDNGDVARALAEKLADEIYGPDK